MIGPFEVATVGIAAGVVVTLASKYFQYLGVRAQHRPPAVPTELDERLRRMEQAIDAIAVEVERVSEGQRFTTRLLAERTPGAPLQAAPALHRGQEVTRAR
ncbi:MAG TPA: hypothetical protein VEZ47_13945 [Gemmatirosa sp.]|nr:hypothetical protein [Gemmatirosa sp.]